MQVIVPCEAFARLSRVATAFEAERDPDYFNSVYFEAHNGNLIAVSTNIKFAAIELIGKTDHPNGAINIACNPALVEQCENEAKFKGQMTIAYVDFLKHATVKTTFGYTTTENVAVFSDIDHAMTRWRSWLPEKMPTGNDSPMFVDAVNLAVLAKSSPSGCILFPEFTSSVVVVRDAYADNWIGAFLGSGTLTDGRSAKEIPVTLPEWVK